MAAAGGTWTGTIPFALAETVVGSKLRFTDVATAVSVDRVIRAQDLLPGDVDGDGEVSIFDVIDTIMAFGSVPGDPTWNANCDFDLNGCVDIFDVITVVQNFGMTV